MTRFSIGEALGAAFKLMRQRPAAVFVWGALIIGPTLAFMPMMMATMSRFVTSLEAQSASGIDPATAPFPADALAGMIGMQLAFGLLNLLQLFALIVVYPAIMRAVIRPQERSWFSIRVSMDEVRVALVAGAVFGGFYIVMMIAMMLVMVAGIFVIGTGSGSDANGVAVAIMMSVLMLAMMVIVLCLLPRFSLMAPATLMTRRFAFAEGWRMAKGQWGRLIGLQLSVIAIILLVELVLFCCRGFGSHVGGKRRPWRDIAGYKLFGNAVCSSGCHLGDMVAAVRSRWPGSVRVLRSGHDALHGVSGFRLPSAGASPRD